jgi:uncharacterized protein (TIGR00255 family)
MTGFARADGHEGACSWTWEARSVNGKGLDIRCRLPVGFEVLDAKVRGLARGRFKRGNLTLALNLLWTEAQGGWRVNEDLLDQVQALMPALRKRWPEVSEPTADGLLSLRDLIEPVEEELGPDARLALEEAVLAGLAKALGDLAAMRAEEGARLADVLEGQIEAIESLCARARECAGMQPAAIRARLAAQVAALLEDVPAPAEERLAQEAALLMSKADISEELDRLTCHVAAARGLLAASVAVGRKLNFLCQEFMRESNTLCAKSTDVELTDAGIELKAVIEQFREQVQNIE